MMIWDSFVRGFHWLLVAAIGALWFTGGKFEFVDQHELLGVFTLALILTRIMWGFWGSENARFRYFLVGPKKVLQYLRNFNADLKEDNHLSHNPLGGWSVIALLLLLLFQGSTGLFTDDAIFFRGPLADWVSNDIAKLLTSIHHGNWTVIKIFIVVHIAAIITYRFKGVKLTGAMIHGRKKEINSALNGELKLRNGLWGYGLLIINTLWLYLWLV
ncbi:MAG: cytochrome b [Idiomarinaceae bacterium HL-53]|nr:MAG: cytochrome b [Idiomarinaceae bacterium HL-53]CUS48658.1 Cytochrome b [Idiomarinaceae bacterium HL-53]